MNPALIHTIRYVYHQNYVKHGALGGPSANVFQKFPSFFTAFLFPALLFPRGLPLLEANERRARHVLVLVPLLTHLGGSTITSMYTLASSFLLTKPISSSAFLASTSTTGRGRESVSRSCALYVERDRERETWNFSVCFFIIDTSELNIAEAVSAGMPSDSPQWQPWHHHWHQR